MRACRKCGAPVLLKRFYYCSYACRLAKRSFRCQACGNWIPVGERETHGQTCCPTKINGRPRPEWVAWQAMIARCTNPKLKAWPYYGGRGIRVCDDWRASFPAFLAHIGPRPTPDHSVDRIENDGNYEPGNVRWALPHVQANNKRRNVPEGSVPLGRPPKERAKPGWPKWYREAREQMQFLFGVRGVPADLYREQWALGETPSGGAKRIYDNNRERWERRR